MIFYTNVFHDLRECYELEPRSLFVVKFSVHIYQISLSKSQLLSVMLDLDNILHICFPLPKAVSLPESMTHLQGQGHGAYIPKIIVWAITVTPYCPVESG